jgi:hypothetical protein
VGTLHGVGMTVRYLEPGARFSIGSSICLSYRFIDDEQLLLTRLDKLLNGEFSILPRLERRSFVRRSTMSASLIASYFDGHGSAHSSQYISQHVNVDIADRLLDESTNICNYLTAAAASTATSATTAAHPANPRQERRNG